MLYQMVLGRIFEQKCAEVYRIGKIGGFCHLYIGQEAIAVGTCAALETSDKVYSTHRCHAHYLAKGGDLKRMMAEICGKAAGCVGGRGGSMHLMDVPKGVMASIPIVSSSIPVAVGSALADKRMRNGKVTVAFFGDASVEEGVFHESANFASLHKLPVIFLCENNL
jgi:pyruvate dehydrogenase E1 component alpha subunit